MEDAVESYSAIKHAEQEFAVYEGPWHLVLVRSSWAPRDHGAMYPFSSTEVRADALDIAGRCWGKVVDVLQHEFWSTVGLVPFSVMFPEEPLVRL